MRAQNCARRAHRGLDLLARRLLVEALLRLREHQPTPRAERLRRQVGRRPAAGAAAAVGEQALNALDGVRRLLEELARAAEALLVAALLRRAGVRERRRHVEEDAHALVLQVGARHLFGRPEGVAPHKLHRKLGVLDRRAEARAQRGDDAVVPRERRHRRAVVLLGQRREPHALAQNVHLLEGVAVRIGLLGRVRRLDEVVEQAAEIDPLGLLERDREHRGWARCGNASRTASVSSKVDHFFFRSAEPASRRCGASCSSCEFLVVRGRWILLGRGSYRR